MSESTVATFAGGCFWCLEAVFERVIGVTSTTSGYCGGHLQEPTYRAVCSGMSGHAEVVEINFDPKAIAYRDLLEIFFAIHDPTQINRQGDDVGTQYRSVIFYHSDEQRIVARSMLVELEAKRLWPAPIATELRPATRFFRAEDEHQHFFKRNPDQPYCQFVVAPKVASLAHHYACRNQQEQ